MSTTFLEANNIKIYAVLSDFAKCRDSRIKSAPRVPKIEGGVQPIRAMPIFSPGYTGSVNYRRRGVTILVYKVEA